MDGCPGVGVTPSQNHLTWINSLWNRAQCHLVNSGTGRPSWGLWLPMLGSLLFSALPGRVCSQSSPLPSGLQTPPREKPRCPCQSQPPPPRGLQSGRGLGPSPLPPTNTSISLLPPPGSGEP